MRSPALMTVMVLLSVLAVSCANIGPAAPSDGAPVVKNTRGDDSAVRSASKKQYGTQQRVVPATRSARAGKVVWESPFTDLKVVVDRRETARVVRPTHRPAPQAVKNVRNWESPFMAGARRSAGKASQARPVVKPPQSGWESPFMDK